jgi:hypothetical protein
MAGLAVTPGAGATIATDSISSEHHTLAKLEYGAAGAATQVSTTAPLPVIQPDLTATGSITTQNLVPAGVATAGSAVSKTGLSGMATAAVQVTGTYTGALSAQVTVDGTNWITLGGTPFLNVNTGVFSATIASAAVGVFQLDVAGFNQFRITGLAAMTGTATVSIQLTNGAGMVALDASIPTGANVIGALTANQSVNASQINGVTPLMGNGVTGTGSLRVTLASDTTTNTNAFLTNQQTSTVGTISSVAAAVASTTILASNVNRRGATVYNDSASATLYLSLSATAASVTVYTLQIPPGGFYELPNTRLYTGQLTGIWSAAVGNARVTENT